MQKIFNVRYWQHLAVHRAVAQTPPDGEKIVALEGIEFQGLAPASHHEKSRAGIPCNDVNIKLALEYDHACAHTVAFEPGMFTLRNWTVAGDAGMLMNFEHRLCLIGDAFGWGRDFAEWSSSQRYGATWNDEKDAFYAVLPNQMESYEDADAVMLSSPGHDIYGHWLLDYVPRLHLLKELGFENRPIFAGRLPKWASGIYTNFGIRENSIKTLADGPLHTFSTMSIPAFAKRGYAIHQSFCQAAWKNFANKMLASGTPAGMATHARIFISRSKWVQSRRIENIAEIEARAAFHRYTVVHPETLNLEAQAKLFHQARVIIGQDGSALHNAIYCQPGAALGVICLPDRTNLWHFSICEALHLRVAYVMAAADAAGQLAVDLLAFDELVLALEDVAFAGGLPR